MHPCSYTGLCPPKEVLTDTKQQSTLCICKEQCSIRQSLSSIIRSPSQSYKNKTSERCFHRVPLIAVNLSSRANKVTWHSTSQTLLSKLQLTCPAYKNFLPFLSLHCSYASDQKLFKISSCMYIEKSSLFQGKTSSL